MSLRKYTYLWLFLCLVLTYEFLMLNSRPMDGLLGYLKANVPDFKSLNLSPEAGRPISLFLGWSGIGVMLLTNLYVLRKRLPFLKKMGSLSGSLNFHIFCGLLGPTLIVFHTGFRVHGLVAISFWSMMIVAASGVIGRYFYVQVAKKRSELDKEAELYEKSLRELQKQAPSIAAEAWEKVKIAALRFAGGRVLAQPKMTPPGFVTLMSVSLLGDLRLAFSSPSLASGMPRGTRNVLRQYAITKRRALFFETFKQYLGYWHSFHIPFAFLMYIVAAIHIVTALIFAV
ncbi:MAG: hypothetical protein P4M08_06335 [Oligoflexia bacterium]|nr:hypothetical protein [Oligoflexia bacterium]